MLVVPATVAVRTTHIAAADFFLDDGPSTTVLHEVRDGRSLVLPVIELKHYRVALPAVNAWV